MTITEIRTWLADPANHESLDFVLPLGLRDAAEGVAIPPDNPLTLARIELGRQLFFDSRLAGPNSSCNCAACHPPTMAFAFGNVFDPQRIRYARKVPTVLNRILSREQFWDGRAVSLDVQAMGPLTNPEEMRNTPERCVATLAAVDGYRLQFESIFGGVTWESISQALACFERCLVTGPSPHDYRRELRRWQARDGEALTASDQQLRHQALALAESHPMSAAALRGESLFYSDRTGCGACHSGPNMTDEQYHNVGVGMDAAEPDLGRYRVTLRNEDRGAFKTPSLRNIAGRLAYFHNGQVRTLEDTVDWFDRGGYANPGLSQRIKPLELTAAEKRDIVEFLHACTGELPRVETGRLPP